MKIEKPFNIIRKAVIGSAEELAKQEGLEYPEKKHYEKVFNVFRIAKNYSPKIFEQLILTSARGKVIKDQLGAGLMGVFNDACNRIINKAVQNNITKISSTQLEDFIRNDNEIINNFSNKNDLLENAISYIKEEFPRLIQTINKE